MQLNNLLKTTIKKQKRIGRGIGSGKGKTGGKGQKGQKVRGKIPAAAVGGGLALYKKLPFKRGWGRDGGNRSRGEKPLVVKLSQLAALKPNTVVELQTLIDNKIISEKSAKKRGVKILADTDLKFPLSFKVPVSKKLAS